MAVDIHPGKAIDQRPPGDLDLLEVRWSQLTRREGFRQRLPGQLDQFSYLPPRSFLVDARVKF